MTKPKPKRPLVGRKFKNKNWDIPINENGTVNVTPAMLSVLMDIRAILNRLDLRVQKVAPLPGGRDGKKAEKAWYR